MAARKETTQRSAKSRVVAAVDVAVEQVVKLERGGLKVVPGRAGPALAEALTRLEAKWGAPLPPSYREFLTEVGGLHDVPPFWSVFPASQLLAASGPMKPARKLLAQAVSMDDADVHEAMHVIGAARHAGRLLLLDPLASRGGEWGVVDFDVAGDSDTYRSFLDWLEKGLLGDLRAMVEEE
jgi:hypothetical protein